MMEMCDQTRFSFDINSCEVRPSFSPISIGPSCLRNSDRKKGGITRNVSFPDDDSQIVTGILEPENPWKSVTDITNEDLISMYISSCRKHGTYPISTVLDQLSKLELKNERNKLFSLKGITLNGVICETLEEILKHIQFNQINLESTALDDEASVALFDMLEYYESATHLNISSNQNIGVRGWQACARMIKKACCLEELEARNTTLNEVSMPVLGRALKAGSQLQVLKLENCNLSGRPLIILASALKVNSNLKELYLSENNLSMNDASQLCSMLKCNTTLQLLDISHNDIKDVGFNYIIEGIIEQQFGLSVLMVWNNHLTKIIAYEVLRLLEASTSLETLNIGQNTLGNEFLLIIKEALITNMNILRLGLQSTLMTNEAAVILSDVLEKNNLIQRIDFRDNNIQITGLEALMECLERNRSLIRLDLDKVPRKTELYTEKMSMKYKSLVEKIRNRCQENEKNIMERKGEIDSDSNEEEDAVRELGVRNRSLKLSVVDSRKISLTCESLHFGPLDLCTTDTSTSNSNNFLGEPKKNGRLRSPAPSPIPSPVSSPSPIRTRFQVSKVTESSNFSPPFCSQTPGKVFSRFKVTVVEPETKPLTDSNQSGDYKETKEEKNYAGKENKNDDFDKKDDVTVVRKDEKIDRKDVSNITEKIRKLSWVSPILQAPAVAIESAKIPANLEKLIGLFQNPFMRQTKPEETLKSGNQIQLSDCAVATSEQETNCNRHSDITGCEDSVLTTLSNEIESEIVSDKESIESKVITATWPQKLSPTYVPSSSKSSSNILEATALVLLQGHVPTDLAGFQNISVNQTEKAASDPS